jgi:hypothetical protein
LRQAQAVRVFEARERLLLQGEDVVLNPEAGEAENHKYDARREGASGWADTEVMQPLLISLVSLSRKIVIYLLVFNLISNELAYLYCNGHTVFSWILTRISDICSNRNKNNLARVLLQASLAWNSWWAISPNSSPLGAAAADAASSLSVIDPVATNLQQLALLAARMNQHGRFKQYSRLLAERNFSIKKELTSLGWRKVKDKAKRWVQPVKEVAKSLFD